MYSVYLIHSLDFKNHYLTNVLFGFVLKEKYHFPVGGQEGEMSLYRAKGGGTPRIIILLSSAIIVLTTK